MEECKGAGASRVADVFSPQDPGDGSSLPLFDAVRSGQGAIAAFLLGQGCDLEQRDKTGATPLYQAFVAGQLPVARQLIEAGADIRATTRLGTRVLDMVLASGKEEQVDWFVRQGVALCSVNGKGNTAQHYACKSGNVALAMRIHDSCGTAFDCAALDGRRPVDWCGSEALFAAIVQRQIADAPKPAQVTAGEEHRAFIMDMANLMSGGRHEDRMLEMQTQLQRTGLGITLFEQAHDCSKADALEMFIEILHDADADAVNYQSADSYHDEETILHRILDSFRRYEPDRDAPVSTLRQCVKLLLDTGANPDAVESLYDETPFHKAAKMACSAYGNGRADDDAAVLAIFEDFVAAGANPNLPNEDGAHVVDLLRHPPLVAWLRAHRGCHGAYPAALFDAVAGHAPDTLAALIAGAGNRFGLDEHDCTLLESWAMDATSTEDWPNALRNLGVLEEDGFAVNATMDDGTTALILACSEGAILQAEWLFSHYAWDLDAQDDWGRVPPGVLVAAGFTYRHGGEMTPKEFRARRDALAVAMVRQGARLDLADDEGDTPLSLCTTVALKTALERAARAFGMAAQKRQGATGGA